MNNSILDLSDLTKPATTLIEKVANAIGVIYEPTHITRVAKAEIEAEQMKAIAKYQISEIERRGIARLVLEEGKKQKNIEDITREAIGQLNDKADPEQIEDDWISHFFDKCRIVTDKEMQGIWSKILAGQSNTPGAYSKKTLDLVACLEKSDAKLFTKICTYIIRLGGFKPFLMVYDIQHPIYTKNGINFESLTHLEDLGLIKFNHLQNFIFNPSSDNGLWTYFDYGIFVDYTNLKKKEFDLGKVLLTNVGKELSKISGSEMDTEFFKYLETKITEKGATILSLNQF